MLTFRAWANCGCPKDLIKKRFKVRFSICFSLLRIHQKVKSTYLLIRWHGQGLLGPLEVSLLTKRSRYKVYKVHANYAKTSLPLSTPATQASENTDEGRLMSSRW